MGVVAVNDWFTAANVARMFRGEPIAELWPPAARTKAEIEVYLDRVIGALLECPQLAIEIKRYPFPASSYVELLCERPEGASRIRRSDEIVEIKGLWVYLSRLIPAYVYGAAEVRRYSDGGAWSPLGSSSVEELPPGDWSAEVDAIKAVLAPFSLQHLDTRIAGGSLAAQPPDDFWSIVGRAPFTNFDAAFYAFS